MESTLCDRRLLGVIANEQTHEHTEDGRLPDLATKLD
jgi:hypothetical protein